MSAVIPDPDTQVPPVYTSAPWPRRPTNPPALTPAGVQNHGLPTCLVRAVVNDSVNGTPVEGAIVEYKLSAYDVDEGYVAPLVVVVETDVHGEAFVALWPNELGAVSTVYHVKIIANGKTLRLDAAVPNVPEADLYLIANLPPWSGESQGSFLTGEIYEWVARAETAANEAEGSASDAAASAAAAAASEAGVQADADAATAAAAAAKASETAAAGSASAADASKTAAAGSASAAGSSAAAAAGSATAAQTAATNAGNSATAAAGSASAASGSATTAQNAATQASGSAANAKTSETNAKGSADAAKASETASGASATNAANSATQAAGSASTAQTAAQTATTQANNAALSAATAQSAATTATNNAATATAAANQAVGSAAAAAGSAAAAAGSAAQADSSAQQAAASAASIDDDVAAAQAAAATATAQAGLAAASAAAASSVAQQDLSGVTGAALHRSPNAITAAIVYDTQYDSEANWPDRMAGRSWMTEALNGNWLTTTESRGFQSELQARAAGATFGSELVVNGTFNTGIASWDISQTTPPSTVTWDSVRQAATLTRTSGNNARMDQSFVTVVNTLYELVVSCINVGGGTPVGVLVGTSQGGTQLVNSGSVSAGVTAQRFYFTATTTTTWLRILSVADGVTAVDNVSLRQVSAFATRSGDFYQLATDGKFYRLSAKNLLVNNSMSGGTSGIYGSGAVVATSWGAPIATGQITYSASARDTGAQQVRFVASAQRPYFSQNVNVAASMVYTLSCFVESIASGSLQIQDVLIVNPVPSGATVTYRKNGGAASNSTAVVAGDFLENIVTVGSTAGSAQCRWGLGSNTNSTGDVTLSVPQFEISLAGAAATVPCEVTTPTSYGETFRGNKAKFPRLSAIVAEAANVTIYDLTEPGRPMWMRFRADTTGFIIRGTTNVSCIAAINGELLVGVANVSGDVHRINFLKDNGTTYGAVTYVFNGNIAQRNTALFHSTVNSAAVLASRNINAVAMTVLPNAPIDPVTVLPVPTIGVAVGTGGAGQVGSVIMNDGSVVNYSQTSNDGYSVAFTKRGEIVWTLNNSSAVYCVPLATSNVASLLTYAANRGYFNNTATTTGSIAPKRTKVADTVLASAGPSGNLLSLVRENPSAAVPNASGLCALITGTYNTGWMFADTRRCVMADTPAGQLPSSTLGTTIITNGTFDTNVVAWTAVSGPGGTTPTVTWSSGTMQVSGTNAADRGEQTVNYVAGVAYEAIYTITNMGTATSVRAAAVRSSAGGFATIGSNDVTAAGTYRFVITPTVTEAGYFRFALTADGTQSFNVDNVIVRPIEMDRSYKAQHPRANGVLAKSAVAAAAQMVAYGGWSNDIAPVGTELITNGGPAFTTTTGWIPATGSANNVGGIVSVVAGNLRIQNDSTGSHWGVAQFSIPTLVGRTYRLTIGRAGGTTAQGVCHVATPGNINNILVNFTGSTTTFVAISTTSLIGIQPSQSIADGYFDFSSMSVKSVDAIGSAANVLQEPYSADLDPGTGMWRGSGWFNVPATAFGPANFCSYSEDLSNASFVKNSVTPTYNVEGTADKIARQAGVSGYGGYAAAALTSIIGGSFHYRVRVKQGAVGGCFGLRIQGTYPNRVDAVFNLATGTLIGTANSGTATNAAASIVAAADQPGYYDATITGTIADAFVQVVFSPCDANYSGSISSFEGAPAATTAAEAIIARQQVGRGTVVPAYTATSGATFIGIAPLFYRGAATGPYYCAGVDGNGMFAAEAYDGTTTRRVTSTAPVNIGTWQSGVAEYDGVGTLALRAGTQALVVATGTPLLTLNNASAALTYGNNFALTAAFPGQIALVKVGTMAALSTQEQVAWMQAQEQALFQPGVQVALPDTGNVQDIAYDDRLGNLLVATSANECAFNGLVRVFSAAAAAGSVIRIDGRTAAKLVSRSTTSPGVDVTLPSQNLKEELNRDGAHAGLGRPPIVLDWVGGFTATGPAIGGTLYTASQHAASLPLYTNGATWYGAQFTGTGVPAGAVMNNINTANQFVSSAVATSAGATSFSFLDFILPVGHEVKTVAVAGVLKQESLPGGAAKDWTRRFDGFRETVRFAAAPGAAAWVQVWARKTG